MAGLRVASVALTLASYANAIAPIAGFRPPSVPLLMQSPEVNVWSNYDALNGGVTTHWEGGQLDFFCAARVDGVSYLLMGSPTADWAKTALTAATQTSVAVMATQTLFTFLAGPVAINLTFTSPVILSDDWDLLSRPAHYITFAVAANDGGSHAVQLYFDVNGNVVVRDPATLVSWTRMPVTGGGVPATVTAMRIGATAQAPLRDTNDRPSWGYAYLLADGAEASSVLEYGNATRAAFWATGALPNADNTQQPASLLPVSGTTPATGPQPGIDRSGNDLPGSPFNLPKADPSLCWAECNRTQACQSWAYGVPNCGGDGAAAQCWLKGAIGGTSSNSCRVSGAQATQSFSGAPLAAAVAFALPAVGPGAPQTRAVVFAVDEILALNWFGEACPPYWRRALPVNDSSVVPMDMLVAAWSDYAAVRTLATQFDATTADMLSAVGGDEYSTVTQLVYRQVVAAAQLLWVPSKQTAWWMLKEISSCGCLNTADVIYPAFALYQYYQPELMKRQLVPLLEYAMNFTNQPYPLPWAPHHLGFWPIADLPYTRQENMPLEETSYFILQIALIAQQQGGDVTWLTPYWPALTQWIDFLVTLLPFPGTQLSTDDFDGQLYNATNLALKGVAAIAAYGYIAEMYTGNASASTYYYNLAAEYSNTMVEYSWLDNGTDSHFMIGYKGSQGDGGDPASWPMLYNALWLRLLGYVELVPNQAALFGQMETFYATQKLDTFGLPLNSRKLYTKDDWQTFLAAYYYDDSSAPRPQPSAFSSALFNKLYTFANVTTSRIPLSDWTNTDTPTSVGFSARPVYGAMYTPVLVALGAQLGIGDPRNPAVARANGVFREVHARRAAARAEAAAAQ